MNWSAVRKIMLCLNLILAAIVFVLLLTGCFRIPVTVHPEHDDKGLPIALPVTPTGRVTPDGQLVPVYPVSSQAPKPPSDWGPMLEQGLTLALGLLVGGGAALPLIRKAKTALSLACNLADAQEATTDPAVLAQNKVLSAQLQDAAGVRSLIKKARGK